jgi:H+/Cl- antiporter ClcA
MYLVQEEREVTFLAFVIGVFLGIFITLFGLFVMACFFGDWRR